MSFGLRKRQRIVLVAIVLALSASAVALMMTAMQEKVAFFLSPSDLAAKEVPAGRQLRVGGLVVDGRIERTGDGVVSFAVTDTANEIRIAYRGILPDLFREGQGIVAQGTLGADGVFLASEVLAKHDENYMPKEVATAIKEAGHWQAGSEAQKP